MAVKLSANYSKKLGLPAYSSHNFSVSLEVELTDLSQVEAECQKLYSLLQQSVDREIQQVGFIPDPACYGLNGTHHHETPGTNGHRRNGSITYCSTASRNGANGERWSCTDGQRGFILRIVNENKLSKEDVEDLAQQLFSAGVRHLNKMQASQLIDELLAKAGKPRQQRWQRPQPTTAS